MKHVAKVTLLMRAAHTAVSVFSCEEETSTLEGDIVLDVERDWIYAPPPQQHFVFYI